MAFSTSGMLATIAMLASIVAAKDGRTYAVVRHSGKPIVEARMDPIISPGQLPSAHVHTVIGGTGFSVSMDTDAALNANGTTAVVNGDKSNYWFPKLYFEADNGTFFDVQPTQFNSYYFFEATDDTIQAFPPGLRMLVGDPFKRTPPYTSSSILDAVDGQDTIQPLQFTCPRADSSTPLYVTNSDGRAIDPQNTGAGIGFPDKNCDAEGTGLRYDVHFPSCYNPAVDVADYTQNTQYPSSANASGGGKQNCPPGWTHTPHLFVEVYWDINHYINEWTPGTGKVPWRLAQGDPYGFGLHMDFISGWKTETLQAMIDSCNAGDTGADKCPDLPGGVNTDQDVTITNPLPDEAVTGALSALPGCNPVQTAHLEAVQHSGPECTVVASNTTSSSSSSSSSSASASAPTTSTPSSSSSASASAPTTSTPSSTSTSGSGSGSGSSSSSSSTTAVAPVSTTTTTPSSLNTTLPTGWTYTGCFTDMVPPSRLRALTGINLAYLGPTAIITPYTCAAYCQEQGFNIAGTEYGGQCFCGDQLENGSTQTDEDKCDMACADGGSSVCGGSAALSLVSRNATTARRTRRSAHLHKHRRN